MARGKRSEVGDTRTAPNGYHYTRTESGWELTGRLVGAQKLGRPLEKTERVRYEDGDKTNNTPDNITVYTVRQGSNKARLARLYDKLEQVQAEIDLLELEDT